MIRPTLFISRRDKNIGDQLASPYRYFGKQLPMALPYEIHMARRLHKIVPMVLRSQAEAVIVGGGGLLAQPYFDWDIEFWTRGPAPTILWGAGHNSHNLNAIESGVPPYTDYGKLTEFALYGVRDYGVGLNWVPCVSCMDDELSKPTEQSIDTLIVLHHDMKRADQLDNAKIILNQERDATVIYNDTSRENFFGSIRSARRVVTNSYHAAYFSTLLQKPVVVVGGGSKVSLLKHPVALAPASDWKPGFANAQIHPTALEECRDANLDFFKRVKSLVGAPRTRPFVRDPVAQRAADEASSGRVFAPVLKNRVPRVVHFVFGLSPDFGGKPFNIMHKIAVRSAHELIKPDAIILHHHYKPDNPEFRSIEGLLTLNKIEVPQSYMGRPLVHFAHKADLVRMNALKETGGIYLDLDTITVRGFDDMLDDSFTIGLQRGKYSDGLCNAVMLSAPNDPFLTAWLDHYEKFSDTIWDDFSVRLPYMMWRSGRWPVSVQPHDRFHWPNYEEDSLPLMFEQDVQFPNASCHHLWESFSYKRYFGGLSAAEAEERIRTGTSTYSRLARPFL